ncbi:GOLPH3/VPS74 family protein [Pseudalkalibacillus caeni]|nr:GPP34 family phosphoprotein [Pseudalkalibacillus caeni]
MLTLPEKLLLLGLHDQKGTIVTSASTALMYGLAGAVLLELTFYDKLDLHKKKVIVKDPSTTGDELLDQVLLHIHESTKQRTPKYWVMTIGNKLNIKNRLLDRLIEKEILRKVEDKILWVFSRNLYPPSNPLPEQELRKRIKEAVFQDGEREERIVALLSLIKACNLINEVFEPDERKAAKKRIKAISSEETYGKAVSQIVSEINTSIIVATTTAAAVSSSSSSN